MVSLGRLAPLADQVLTSFRSAFTLLCLALVSPQESFGLLALVLTATQLTSGLISAVIVDQWLVRGARGLPGRRALAQMALGGATVMLAIGLALDQVLAGIVAASLAPACIYELVRVDLAIAGRSLRLLATSAAAPALVGLSATLTRSTDAVVASYSAGLLAACSWGILGVSSWLDGQGGTAFFSGFSMRRGLTYAFDYVTSVGYGQLVVLVSSLLLPALAAAGLRLTQSLFALPGIALVGVRVVVLRKWAEGLTLSVYFRFLALASLGTSCAAAVTLVFVWVCVGVLDPGLESIVRETSTPLAIQSVLLGSGTLGGLALKALGRQRLLVIVRLAVVTLSALVVALLLVIHRSPAAAAWGLALGTAVGAVIWNISLWNGMRSCEQ